MVTRHFLRPTGEYWLLPFLAVLSWTATLLGLLITWLTTDHHKEYQISESYVVFISDVGAAHTSLFIAGTALTLFFYALTLLVERYLRHLRRIPGSINDRSPIWSILAIVFGILGGIALLLLSIFNAFKDPTAHWILTAVFVVCIAISASFQTAEVRTLEVNHPGRAHLRRSAIVKLIVVILAVFGAIAFGATRGSCRSTRGDSAPPTHACNVTGSAAAVLEWFIAFLFDIYLFTFILDLLPARRTSGHSFDPSLIEADRNNTLHRHKHSPSQVADVNGDVRHSNSSHGSGGSRNETLVMREV